MNHLGQLHSDNSIWGAGDFFATSFIVFFFTLGAYHSMDASVAVCKGQLILGAAQIPESLVSLGI